jgi:hypothetical protein
MSCPSFFNAQTIAAMEAEWSVFCEQRKAGIEEIKQLRLRVAEEESRKQLERANEREKEAAEGDVEMVGDVGVAKPTADRTEEEVKPTEDGGKATAKVADMEVDEVTPPPDDTREERHEEPVGDDDDAVEY